MVVSLVLSAIVDQAYVKETFPQAYGVLSSVAGVLSAVLMALTKKTAPADRDEPPTP